MLSAGASRGHCGPNEFLLPLLACLHQEVLSGSRKLAGSPVLSLGLSPWWGHKRPDCFSRQVLTPEVISLSSQPGTCISCLTPRAPQSRQPLSRIHIPPTHLTVSFYTVDTVVRPITPPLSIRSPHLPALPAPIPRLPPS